MLAGLLERNFQRGVSPYNFRPVVVKLIVWVLSTYFVVVRQRINAVLLFFLLTAFLAVQWTPAHAHLTVQHDHSGERHQHKAEAHAHQAAAFHTKRFRQRPGGR